MRPFPGCPQRYHTVVNELSTPYQRSVAPLAADPGASGVEPMGWAKGRFAPRHSVDHEPRPELEAQPEQLRTRTGSRIERVLPVDCGSTGAN